MRADNRIEFHPEPQVVLGNNPPVWADVPFITGQMLNGDNVAEGNMLFDTGARLSILSSEMAFQLGLDTATKMASWTIATPRMHARKWLAELVGSSKCPFS